MRILALIFISVPLIIKVLFNRIILYLLLFPTTYSWKLGLLERKSRKNENLTLTLVRQISMWRKIAAVIVFSWCLNYFNTFLWHYKIFWITLLCLSKTCGVHEDPSYGPQILNVWEPLLSLQCYFPFTGSYHVFLCIMLQKYRQPRKFYLHYSSRIIK